MMLRHNLRTDAQMCGKSASQASLFVRHGRGVNMVYCSVVAMILIRLICLVIPCKGKCKVNFYIAQYPADGPLKALYISSSGKPVHHYTNSTSLGNIQSGCNKCNKSAKIRSHLHRRIWSDTSFVQLGELRRFEENQNAQASTQQQRGFEPGFSRLRIWHYVAVCRYTYICRIALSGPCFTDGKRFFESSTLGSQVHV